MSSRRPKAIVFNTNFNGLSIIQELAGIGVECVAMDSVRSIGAFSRYAKYVKCPNPAENEMLFIEFLYSYCSSQELPPVLFPTNDQWATAVSMHKARLSEVARICVADWEAVSSVIDKNEFYRLGQDRGYMTPRTWEHSDLSQLPTDAFPIAAKPVYRRHSSSRLRPGFNEAMDRLRLEVFRDSTELSSFLAQEQEWLENLVFQEFVPGLSNRMYTIGTYIDERHEIKALFTGRKIRGYPADIGDCVVGEVHSVPDELVRNAERIARDLQLTGIAEFEYKHNPDNGNFTLIEINPRSWSWIGITPACGVNIPVIAYHDLTGIRPAKTRTKSSSADGSVRYAKVIEDAINCWWRYKSHERSWLMNPLAWRQSYRGKHVVKAEFYKSDYLVTFRSLLRGLKQLVVYMYRGATAQ